MDLVALAAILVLGVVAQLVAWKLHLPSILVLLLVGFLAGPISGLLAPDELLGDLLPSIIGLGVAIILFEGGLGLRWKELRARGDVVFRLVTVGVLVTWAVGTIAARMLLGVRVSTALLLGAILVVSGPTVVQPLLRHVRANKTTTAVLRWEGILIDPIGAILAALVFEFVIHGGTAQSLPMLGTTLMRVVSIGALCGLVGAVVFILAEKRYLIPDFLAAASGLALVLGVFTAAESFASEAGLFAVTFMGVILANQPWVSVRHLLDFKEDISLLTIGALFILLAARVERSALGLLDWRMVAFLLVLVLVARPLAVLASAAHSRLEWRERTFLAWVAPRGIVAAAVAAFFAIKLEEAGAPEADLLVPYTFIVIVGTVLLYGLTARPVARLLKVAQPAAEGVLFIGANATTRALGSILKDEGYRVLLADTNSQALTAARVEGLDAVRANVAAVHLTDDVDLSGIGQVWAMTPNHEANSLAAVHFADTFGRANVYQIASEEDVRHLHLQGRTLFGKEMTYRVLRDRSTSEDWSIRKTPITDRFDAKDHQEMYPDAVRLALIDADGRLWPFTTDASPDILPGSVLIALVKE